MHTLALNFLKCRTLPEPKKFSSKGYMCMFQKNDIRAFALFCNFFNGPKFQINWTIFKAICRQGNIKKMSFNCYWKILNTPCRFNFYSQIDRHEVYPKPTLKTFIRLERSHWNIGIRSFQILSHELFYSGMIWTLAGCSLTFYLYMFHGSIVLHICISTALQFCISTALQF